MLYMGQPINSSRNIRLLWIGGSKIDAKKSSVLPKPRWISPPQGYVKLNVDAAISKTSNGGALGVVCDKCVLSTQLGTPRGRYEEHSSKFLSVVKPRFIEPVGESQTSKGDAC
jgi:hypothetical protein